MRPRIALAAAVLAATFISVPSRAPAADTPGTLEEAVAAYGAAQEIADRDERRAAFTRAERLFAHAAQTGPASADLYANIGTAALQGERLGAAILAYRRALALDPDHRRASQNLEHARTLLPAWVPRPEAGGILDGFFGWSRTMSAGERAGAAALAFLIGCGLLGAGTVLQSGVLRAFSVLPLLLWAVLLASTLTSPADSGDAVVIADDTVARASDSRNSPARFAEPIPAGTEVRIAEQRSDWLRVTMADGRDAWLPAAAVERVR